MNDAITVSGTLSAATNVVGDEQYTFVPILGAKDGESLRRTVAGAPAFGGARINLRNAVIPSAKGKPSRITRSLQVDAKMETEVTGVFKTVPVTVSTTYTLPGQDSYSIAVAVKLATLAARMDFNDSKVILTGILNGEA